MKYMKFLYIGFVSLIIGLNIGLVLAFHNGGERFYGPEDFPSESIARRPLSQPEFILAPPTVDESPRVGGSGRGYWKNVPLEGGYQEGQYQRRWVSADEGASGQVGIDGTFYDSPFEGVFDGGIESRFGSGIESRFGGGIESRFGGNSFQIDNPLGGIDTIQKLVNRLIDALIVLATPIAVIMVLWGGFLVMTSVGESARYIKGGKVILYAAVGYGILLLAKGVTAIIESIVYDTI